jgi:hypothetical protein
LLARCYFVTFWVVRVVEHPWIVDRPVSLLPNAAGLPPEEAMDRAVAAIDKILEGQLNWGDYRRVHAALTQPNKMFQWRYLKGLFAARIRALAGRARVEC